MALKSETEQEITAWR